MIFFDSHAHYNDEKFDDDREDILNAIKNYGIDKVIIPGYSIESSQKAVSIANGKKWLYATCGVSPNDLVQDADKAVEVIGSLCKDKKKVVAIGEIGLDYYWNKENKNVQKEFFKKQIKLANELNLPIVIHSRDASIDTISILNEIRCNKNGVFHCCQFNLEMVKSALKLGYYISFAGPCTFKNSKNAIEVIKQVPLDRILIETDSPYLAPEPVRGTRNDSRNVKIIAEKIAEIREMPLEDIAKITFANAEELFGI